jgi:tRNA-guanine family transglycosylase
MGEFVNVGSGAGVGTLPANQMDAILYNVPQSIDSPTSILNTRKLIDEAKPRILFQDSGGFQLHEALVKGDKVTFDPTNDVMKDGILNLTPNHLIAAAMIFNPDIMMGLDNPIPEIKNATHADKQIKFWEYHGYNLRWAKESSRLRGKYCPEIELFIPVQCYTLQQLNYFLEDFGDTPCDGFSIPQRNHEPQEIAVFMLKLYHSGCRKVHILGSFALRVIALAAYFARNYFDFVSLDCTLWRSDAEYSKYYLPLDLRSVILKDNFSIDESVENTCPCPWCRDKTFLKIKNMPYPERHGFLRRHNYWAIEQAMREFYDHAETALSLKTFLSEHCGRKKEIQEIYNFLNMLEHLKDEKPETAIDLMNNAFC